MFICDFCEKAFSRKSILIRHLQNGHTNDDTEPKPFVCDSCAKAFQRKDNLKSHMKKVHNIIATKNVNLLEKSFLCDTCPSSFTSKRSLCRHMISIHKKIIERNTPKKDFVCDFCPKSFTAKNNRVRHMKYAHDKVIEAKKGKKTFGCDICSKLFSSESNVVRHKKYAHHVTPDKNVPPKPFKCESCSKTFSRKTNLNGHMKKVHNDTFIDNDANLMGKSFVCDSCNASFPRKCKLLKHIEEVHTSKVGPEELSFQDETEFYGWKESIEEQSVSSFTISSSYTCKLTNSRKILFVCNRSGYYQPRPPSARKRKSPAYGSKKINSVCPAKIKAIFTDNKVLVQYSPKHYGHEHTNKPCYMNIPTSTRHAIASQLLKGVPLPNIKRSLLAKETRPQLITRHDIRNIGNKYGARQREQYDKNDAISVQKWVNANEDSVLLYKAQGSVDYTFPDLNSDDFVLIIMTEKQKLVFSSFGNNVIVVDSTHGLNGYGFPLTTIMVLDEANRGHPVAFMFSNKIDDQILEIFFEAVQNNVGDLRTKIFMTDMTPEYWNAWIKIFPEPQYHLFSPWHVLRAWRDSLNGISVSKKLGQSRDAVGEMKRKIYRFLRCNLMQQMNVSKFTNELEDYLSEENVILEEFQNYFQTHYAPYVEQWASCHRKIAGICANMVCEPFHKIIKYHHLGGRKIRRVDKALKAIFDHLNKKLNNEITKDERDSVEAYKQISIQERHRESFEGDVKFIFPFENYWAIESFRTKRSKDKDVREIHIVRENEKSCADTCYLFCNGCNSCAHKYNCSCSDHLILGNMCKHIHLLCRFLCSQTTQVGYQSTIEITDVVEEFVYDATDVNMMQSEDSNDSIEAERYSLLERVKNLVQSARTRQDLDSIKNQLQIMEICTLQRNEDCY